ncbi:uncharacterized protein ASPGLDRAFT_23141 [Aspergillus glaucus CBS 516.65]|uniref:Uncharacterized protein n=1 Tax=Aspergillus glaucus CBS 516.65 TaxID=1160497 RepID=A0A1L9VT60_ASPGL|nr:hypothetical protein ASPGLDRAFT_23141 [Aspergillus glaucus CBS 516.65]OJJ87097.1 hypothetical protein ASPGLDRAFT_23141 [Aspergillus glaucus CBS 516.65]
MTTLTSLPLITLSRKVSEDLDERKYSLMLIHVMQTQPEKNVLLCNIMAQRQKKGRISDDHKCIVLEQFKQSRNMDFTLVALQKLQAEIGKEVKVIAHNRGTKDTLEPLLSVLEV